jgi:hypothetical protein
MTALFNHTFPAQNKRSRMVFGMSLATYTTIHVILSLIGIASGLIVLAGLLGGRILALWNGSFLIATVLTSATAFGFPFTKATPGIILGILSLIVLAIAIFACYARHLSGVWRRTYVITAMIALYFNVFVLVAQLFEHVPAIHTLAPTQTEAPFKTAQLLLLVVFAVLIGAAAKRSRTVPA